MMQIENEYSAAVKAAIDDVIVAAGVRNCNALARRLDVTKQALSKWRQTGNVPAFRAMQMELVSGGAVSWQRLCPDVVVEFTRNREVICATARSV